MAPATTLHPDGRPRGRRTLLLGYKVMGYDAAKHEAVSGADARVRLTLRDGEVHEAPRAGIFLGASPEYVVSNYAVFDPNVLLAYAFDPDEIVHGHASFGDREPEVSVRRARLLAHRVFAEDEDEDVLRRPNPPRKARRASTR